MKWTMLLYLHSRMITHPLIKTLSKLLKFSKQCGSKSIDIALKLKLTESLAYTFRRNGKNEPIEKEEKKDFYFLFWFIFICYENYFPSFSFNSFSYFSINGRTSSSLHRSYTSCCSAHSSNFSKNSFFCSNVNNGVRSSTYIERWVREREKRVKGKTHWLS